MPDHLPYDEESIDPTRLDDVRIILDLERLGELIAAVAHKFTLIRDIEPPDFDGEEMRELAIAGWEHVRLMGDRANFAASVLQDLEKLDKVEVSE